MNIFLKIVIALFVLIAIIIAASKFLLCPAYKQAPVPGGQYAVGTKLFHLTDQNRNESRLESGKREINIKFYYPSNSLENKDKLYPYYPEQLAANKQSYRKIIPLPEFVYNCMFNKIYSHSEPNAPISQAKDKFPIIIFLPGINSNNEYESYLEDIASHGYIVIVIEPTFDIMATNLSGKIIELDESLQKAVKETNRDEIYKYRNNAHKVWVGDINFVINELKKYNNNSQSIFYNKLDFNNIGFLGHSHGGAVVTEFCDKNPICKACINMDGWTKTANENKEYKSNLMFLLNEEGYDFIDAIYKDHNQQAPLIKVPGAQHGAFSDGILLKEPLHTIFKVTTKNPEEVRKTILNQVITFFDKWLKQDELNGYELLKNSGKNLLGTTTYHWMDANRIETHSANPQDKRELLVQIWYPANKNNQNTTAPYLPKDTLSLIKEDLAKHTNIPVDKLSYLDNIQTHSFLDSKLSYHKQKYPVIIFSPGWGTPVNLYTNILQDLASHGNVVVAINYPYVTNPVVFPNGRIIKQSANDKKKELKVWVEDIKFVVDKLEEINKNDPRKIFTQKLDLNNIGLLGHSFGGSVSLEACKQDNRCKAIADIEGKLYETTELNKPVLFIVAPHEAAILQPIKDFKSNHKYYHEIEGADHGSFTDLYLIVDWPNRPSINPTKPIEITRELLNKFFDKWVKIDS